MKGELTMESGEETKTGFVIDGVTYPVPDIGTFNMDEGMILYDACGLGLADFAIRDEEGNPDEEAAAELGNRMANPAFVGALMQIAYLRGNPGTKRAKAEAIMRRSNQTEAYEAWVLDMLAGEDEGSPPEQESTSEPETSEPETSEPGPSSPRSSVDSKPSSGNASAPASDERADVPSPTGITRLPTSPTVDRVA